MRIRLVLGAALLLVLLATGGVTRARAEERTIQATAPWQGRARVYVTGPRQGFLLGSFVGRLAAQGESSALDGAQLMCPTAIEAEYTTNTLRGDGRCVLTTGSGDRLFARWSCTGEPDKGCAGRFVLTGGTGTYQGVTGDGDFTLRIILSEITSFEKLEAEYDLAGLATWPGLRYRTP
jgi:hypothetical protein